MTKIDVPLIPQVGNQTCWQAVMRMIASAKRGASVDPTTSVSWLSAKGSTNQGLQCFQGAKFSSWASISVFADAKATGAQKNAVPHIADCSEPLLGLKDAGFHAVPSMPDPIDALWLERALSSYGALFAGGYWLVGSGSFHALAITGVDTTTGAVYSNDPWPVGSGVKDRTESIHWLNAKMNRDIPFHFLP